MDAAAELGRNPVSKHHIQPEYRDEQADAGRTAGPVSRDQILRRERGQGKKHFPCSANHEQDCSLTRLIHTLAVCVTIHTYNIPWKSSYAKNNAILVSALLHILIVQYHRVVRWLLTNCAPVVQLVTSKPSYVGTWVRITVQSHEPEFFLTKKIK